MKVLLPMTAFFWIAACGQSKDSSPVVSEPMSARDARPILTKTLDETEAKKLMDSMLAVGITDPVPRMGARHLAAETIECFAPVVPHPVARCSVHSRGEVFVAPEAVAQDFYQVLVKAGAVLLGGPIGSSHAVATDIACSRAVVLNPRTHCTLKVQSQQP